MGEWWVTLNMIAHIPEGVWRSAELQACYPSVYQSGFTEEALSYGNPSPLHLMWFRAAVTVWYNTIKRLDIDTGAPAERLDMNLILHSQRGKFRNHLFLLRHHWLLYTESTSPLAYHSHLCSDYSMRTVGNERGQLIEGERGRARAHSIIEPYEFFNIRGFVPTVSVAGRLRDTDWFL